MATTSINELVNELTRLYNGGVHGPFPYEDCWKLLDQAGDEYEDLVPDLDMEFYFVASICGGARQLLQRGLGELKERQQALQGDWYSRYPHYKPLESVITEAEFPQLYHRLSNHERGRRLSLELIEKLIEQREDPR